MAITSAAQQGLEIGRRALQAQQVGLNTTGHNVANANTPGFSRRQVSLETAVTRVDGAVGSGADAAAVERQRSRFADAQVRVQQQVLGHWQSLERALQSLEAAFNEPAGAGASEAGTVFSEASGMGLSGSLSRFWNTWQDLANAPEDGAARAAVRQEGEFLATTLNQYHTQLVNTRSELDVQVQDTVSRINELVDQLAQVNAQLPRARFEQGAADLEDQRDRLVESLSLLVDVAVNERENGQVAVLLGGHTLVEGDRAVHLRLRQSSEAGGTASRVAFSDDLSLAQITEGELRGTMQVRDEVVPDLLSRLDQVAAGLVWEVNRVHRSGYGRDGTTGIDFFAAANTSAGNIRLSEEVAGDLGAIAASADGHQGDNGTALAISGLRERAVLDSGTMTIEGFYRQLLGEVGARSQEAQTMAENHRLFAQQIENRRQSIQGVSLNDEAAQLVLFQRAYQAAARTVSIVDELMEVAINL
ncbi:MAG: flagellar hook-associated protein FlgK [Candidatus Latescibacterota bacterium]